MFDENGDECYDENDYRPMITKKYAKGEEWNKEDRWEVNISFKKINKGK